MLILSFLMTKRSSRSSRGTSRRFGNASNAPDTSAMRFVTVKGAVYFRAEDVANFVETLGATEETDVRNRLRQAARNMSRKRT